MRKEENHNIIFTVKNTKLLNSLSVLLIISFILIVLFFTVIPSELIILASVPMFLIFTIPIFMYGFGDKIIYRFTSDELQFRGSNPVNIKWNNIDNWKSEDELVITLKNNSVIKLPYTYFSKNEINDTVKQFFGK